MARRGMLLIVLVAAWLAIAAAPGAAGHNGEAVGVQRMGSLESQLLGQINALRARHGLARLKLSKQLSAASALHSSQMAKRGFFAHESADGTMMSDRVERFYRPGNSRYWSVGENLLWSSPSIAPKAALDLWLGSPGHRANLLSREWREIGVAAVHAASAPGYYGGEEVTIVTTDFGVRR